MASITVKPQRFAVTYKTRLLFVSAPTPDEALARARTRLLVEAAGKREDSIRIYGASYPLHPDPDEALADDESFKAAARVKPSLRY